MIKEVDILKLAALSYWRFDRQHIIGAIECQNADVKTMTRAGMLTETEVKISIADMQSEIRTKRFKHWRMNGDKEGLNNYDTHYFYFLVPSRLLDKAIAVCADRYPYAGLLVLEGEVAGLYYESKIRVIRPSKRFKRKKASIGDITRLGYGATLTAMRYGDKLIKEGKLLTLAN